MYIVTVTKGERTLVRREYNTLTEARREYLFNYLKWARSMITLSNSSTGKVLLAHTNN